MTDRRTSGPVAEHWPLGLETLERRVTLAVSLLLAAVIAGMFWMSRSRVIDAVSESEMARLQTSSDEFARTLEQQAERLRQHGMRVAAIPELRDALQSPRSAGAVRAAAAALEVEGRASPQIHHVALLDRAGGVVATSGANVGLDTRDNATGLETVSGATVGPLKARADTILYTVTAPITVLGGSTIGHVVITRRLSSGAESAALMSGLVGRGAQLVLGNADGTLLTDLTKSIERRRTVPGPGTTSAYADPAGQEFLGASSLVETTPWMVIVETPRAGALRAASDFTFESALFGSAFVLVGAFLSWLLINRTMSPLGDVTDAAREIAAGNMGRRAAVRGRGEIAMLGAAFNKMVERVGRSTEDLSARAFQLERSNKELNESEAKYRSLFEHLPDGVLVHHAERILFANPAAVRLLAVTSESDLVGRPVLDFIAQHDRDLVRGRIGQIVRHAQPMPTIEVRVQRADHKLATVEATSMPLRVGGSSAVQTILHDVTERRQLEEQFRQSQKMDAVGRLAGGVAHDFNNLLTVIQAHAEFALAETDSEADRRKDIEEIKRTAESAARLTRQLLTFSRKQALTPAHIDLNDAIAGMLGMIKRLIGSDIEVVTVAGNDLAGIWADPGQIQQVLLNLAVNARDAMPDGGVLRFETANVTVGEGYVGATATTIPAGDYVMLAVQDTGVGMTEEIRSRVFEPFFTTKQAGKGTGLGLSTVYGIVKQSGGHIWVYSEPGMGTAFKVFFPPHWSLDAGPGADAGAAVESAPAHGHLLVVEDDPGVRAAVVRALRGAGYTVTEAGHAVQALEVIRSDRTIDLLITDMVMPGKLGISLLADAREIRPRLPAIVLSGYSEHPSNELWRVPDHSVFVEKPVSPAELIRRVSQLLARHS